MRLGLEFKPNSHEHKRFVMVIHKMPTINGILKLMTRTNYILCYKKQEISLIFCILIL